MREIVLNKSRLPNCSSKRSVFYLNKIILKEHTRCMTKKKLFYYTSKTKSFLLDHDRWGLFRSRPLHMYTLADMRCWRQQEQTKVPEVVNSFQSFHRHILVVTTIDLFCCRSVWYSLESETRRFFDRHLPCSNYLTNKWKIGEIYAVWAIVVLRYETSFTRIYLVMISESIMNRSVIKRIR